jgi:homoserine kinase
LPVDNVFTWVVALPEATVNTREARTRLPRTVPLETAVRQGGNVAALVTALARGDGALLAASFDDRIAEPVRFAAIPGYIQVKRAALDAGALACSISGSGPAVFAVTTGPAQAKRVGRAMKAMFLSAARLESTVYASRLNMTGAGVKRP